MKSIPAVPVLIAEDDRATRNTHRFLLGVAGYPVAAAASVRPALDALLKHPAGMVVVLDWEMPRGGCMRILRGVARVPDAAALHRYLLLAPAPDRVTSYILSLPASLSITILRKPIERDDLLAAVRDAARAISSTVARVTPAP